jgi:hypothetical protein
MGKLSHVPGARQTRIQTRNVSWRFEMADRVVQVVCTSERHKIGVRRFHFLLSLRKGYVG